MSPLRQVTVTVTGTKPIYNETSKRMMRTTVDRGVATFHAWGHDYEEFENNAGNYSVAIIEWPDGTVETVKPENIKFLPEPAAPDTPRHPRNLVPKSPLV